MIVGHKDKIVFLRVPKTASTSISDFLVQNFEFGENDIHTPVLYTKRTGLNCNIEDVHLNLEGIIKNNLITEKQISEYQIFGLIREPVDRFISIAHHTLIQSSLASNKKLNNNEAVEIVLKNLNIKEGVFKPQTFWLIFKEIEINNIILYQNINDLIKSILGREEKLNLHYRSESRQDKTSVLAQDLVKEINSIYKKDKDLYEKYYNKTQRRN